MRLPWRTVPPAFSNVNFSVLVEAALGLDTNVEGKLVAALCRYLALPFVELCDSGTSALRIALEQSTTPGEIVAMPAFSCYDLATAALGARVNVLFYDVDPSTLSPDLESLERAFREGPRAAVVASVFGYAPQMSEIAELAHKYGATLIEDIAQGMGALHNGRPLGSWGDIVTVSFGRGKVVGGAGGGAIGFRTARSRIEMPPFGRFRSALGLASIAAQQVLSQPQFFAIPRSIPMLGLGETVFREPFVARRMAPSHAGIALSGVESIESLLTQRRQTATALLSGVEIGGDEQLRILPIVHMANSLPGFLRIGFRGRGGMPNSLVKVGGRRSYPRILPELAALRDNVIGSGSYPGALELSRCLFSLPSHELVNSSDLQSITSIILEAMPPESGELL